MIPSSLYLKKALNIFPIPNSNIYSNNVVPTPRASAQSPGIHRLTLDLEQTAENAHLQPPKQTGTHGQYAPRLDVKNEDLWGAMLARDHKEGEKRGRVAGGYPGVGRE